MDNLVLSVHQLNEYVKGLLDKDPILQRLCVRGEISNFKLHSTGHMYFTLKDEQSRIRCVRFRTWGKVLEFLPSDGMKVIITGHISLYCRDGQYQLYVESMERDGIGELYQAFEALKQKLREEGLFNPEHKKVLPPYPSKVGVITSATGAAVRDIIKVIKRRNPCVSILVIPVTVQGDTARDQLCMALDYINTRKDIDVVIIGRGGGSIEELWAFNEECVARAIHRSTIPVVSAVGHETDFTIADFVADLRAPTPSAAGEMVVPDIEHMSYAISEKRNRIYDAMARLVKHKEERLTNIKESYIFRYPERLLSGYRQRLGQGDDRLRTGINQMISAKREAFYKLVASLDALSPLAVLSRGYTVAVHGETKRIVTSIKHVSSGDIINLRVKDGRIMCGVAETKKEKIEYE